MVSRKRWHLPGLLLIVAFLLQTLISTTAAHDCSAEEEHVFGENSRNDEWEMDEFKEFCQLLKKRRESPQSSSSKVVDATLCEEEEFDVAGLRMLFVLMLMISYGALVRSVLKFFKLNIPYTVLLMISGLLIGYLSTNFCTQLFTYTSIARIPPKVILFTFLPVLIFESAFSISPHTFMRSMVQILIVSFPGMIMATFATGLICQQFFAAYKWSFVEASLFGSIVSATDPVAVVAILGELGTSEMLSVMIEGESLLNDGVAILLYEMLIEILTCEVKGDLVLYIFRKFCQITLGGPALGFVMGKIAVYCLSLIFNDATVEITITLVAAYMTYYVGEDILGVSGVMAVVALGITMGAEKTSISPEIEDFVHHFWAMLGYFANTVLFMIVGILITETALSKIDIEDWIYLLFLYISLNIVRLLMLAILYPLVSRFGYGLTWQNMMVMMWGGLRGAVGICLALDVYDNETLCQQLNLGPKFLFQVAGIVFLTLVVNGTTTKMLLEMLKLTEISTGRLQDMANAVKQLENAQYRTVNMLKHDRFLADSNWNYVDKYTIIKNPYGKKSLPSDLPLNQSLVSIKANSQDYLTECPDCHTLVKNEPTNLEFMEMTEEARLRVLKALKVSVWRQFEQGVLVELAVLNLVNIASATEDKPLRLVHASDLRKYWRINGCLPWIKKRITKHLGFQDEVLPPMPKNSCRRAVWWLVTRDCFEGVIILVILLNMIPAIWESVYIYDDNLQTSKFENVFFGLSLFFNCIYLAEAILKIIGRGPHDYFCVQKSNWIDIIVLILGGVDIVLYIIKIKATSVFVFVKLLRVARAVRLLKPIVPRLMLFVDKKINAKLFLGYDVGKGFVTAAEDVIKYLPQMVDHPKVMHKLKNVLERERLETVREMGIMQKDHPGIAIAVKTHHASRAVLNQMKESLMELKEDGLVDAKESDIIMIKLEENMKKLWNTPPSIAPAPPESLLENVFWIGGRPEIFQFFHERAILLSFAYGDIIFNAGERSNGVYIITSGMVKIHYIPTDTIVKKFDQDGEIPCMELFEDLTFRTSEDDFFSTGTVLGEQSILTNQLRAAVVKCETNIFAYHISEAVMREALMKFDDKFNSLECCIWRAVGMRVALAVLPKHPSYSSWTMDKIRLRLEKSCVPIGDEFNTIKVYDFIADILIIQGKVKDSFSNDIFFAPQLVPRGVSKLELIHSPTIKTRVLVIAYDDVDTASAPAPEQEPSKIALMKHLDAVVEQGCRISENDRTSKGSHPSKFGHRAKPRKAKRDLSMKPGFPTSVTRRSHRSRGFSTTAVNDEVGDVKRRK
ncbi:unnamed protein product [Allacma fusca]|uniref:Cyclic nucleotide-binding domain-containing protein n=1 Tax=Allacma fusca TaxID=39272 RepID=A0A8J2KZG5_9HEXA|nr:unnamed protein product [Allacma fusca]